VVLVMAASDGATLTAQKPLAATGGE